MTEEKLTKVTDEHLYRIYARISEANRIGILLLIKFTDEKFTSSPEKIAKLNKEFDDTVRGWEESGVTISWYSTVMMNGKFDRIMIFEVDDLGQWVKMAEEYEHHYGTLTKYQEIYIGVNPPYFFDSTKDIPWFKKLHEEARKLGSVY